MTEPRTVYELDLYDYYMHLLRQKRDAELEAFMTAHGLEPKRVRLSQTLTITEDDNGLNLNAWVFDVNETGNHYLGDDGEVAGRTHVVPLAAVPPLSPTYTAVHKTFTCPDGTTVFKGERVDAEPVPFVSASVGTTGHVLAQEVAAQRAAADEIQRNTPPLVAGTPVEAGKSYVITGGFPVPVLTTPTCPTCCTHDHTGDAPELPADIGPNDQPEARP